MIVVRALCIGIFAGLAGAFSGELITGGSIHYPGPAIFVSYFTLMGSFAFLAPAYAIMKSAEVPLSRRYIGVFSVGALAGAIVLLPIDFASGHFNGAPLGAFFGAVTGAYWVLFHAASRAITRRDRPAA